MAKLYLCPLSTLINKRILLNIPAKQQLVGICFNYRDFFLLFQCLRQAMKNLYTKNNPNSRFIKNYVRKGHSFMYLKKLTYTSINNAAFSR